MGDNFIDDSLKNQQNHIKKTILALAAGLTSFAGNAKAEITWDWTLTLRGDAEAVLGNGQFISGDDLGNGVYQITSISGIYMGATITGLQKPGPNDLYYSELGLDQGFDSNGGLAFNTATPF